MIQDSVLVDEQCDALDKLSDIGTYELAEFFKICSDGSIHYRNEVIGHSLDVRRAVGYFALWRGLGHDFGVALGAGVMASGEWPALSLGLSRYLVLTPLGAFVVDNTQRGPKLTAKQLYTMLINWAALTCN